jgi:pimeloyl-ACP methyl ester carboxylesterase
LANSYSVVKFDSTHTFGESDGRYEDVTATNYITDLEDVIGWAEKQEWFQAPFVLVGHSLGGLSSACYAEKYPQRVKALAPISTVVSGSLYLTSYSDEERGAWQETGFYQKPSKSRPGLMKRVKWQFAEDVLKYDLLPDSRQLNMPVLMVVGSQDKTTFPEHQQILFDRIPSPKKELYIIKESPHTFSEPEHLAELRSIFHDWIKRI